LGKHTQALDHSLKSVVLLQNKLLNVFLVNLINHEEKIDKDKHRFSRKDFKTELDEKLSERNNKSLVLEPKAHDGVEGVPQQGQEAAHSEENLEGEEEAFDIFNENLSSDHSERDMRKNSSIVVEEDVKKALSNLKKKSVKKVQIKEQSHPVSPKVAFDEHDIYNVEESQAPNAGPNPVSINYALIEERLMILSIAYHNLAVEMEYLSNPFNLQNCTKSARVSTTRQRM
jgi:hypothetical protein